MALQTRHGKKEYSAGGIVYRYSNNREKEWLVVQHSQHKGWIFPKGLIGDEIDNEGKEETALREVEEEGGIKAKIVNNKPFSTQYVYTYNGQKTYKTVYFFLMEYVSGDIKNHDWEVSEARWLTEEEVFKTLTFDVDKRMFKEAVNNLKLITKN